MINNPQSNPGTFSERKGSILLATVGQLKTRLPVSACMAPKRKGPTFLNGEKMARCCALTAVFAVEKY